MVYYNSAAKLHVLLLLWLIQKSSQMNLGQLVTFQILILHLLRNRTSEINEKEFLLGWLSFLPPNHTISVEAPNNTKHWPKPPDSWWKRVAPVTSAL